MSTDDDRTWAELVASFHASPDVDADPEDASRPRRRPEIEDVAPEARTELSSDATFTLGALGGDPRLQSRSENDPDDATEPKDTEDTDDDHFQPLPPPPLPRGDLVSRLAWTGVIAAPLGLIVATVTPWEMPTSLLGVLSLGFVGGFVTLVVRMRGPEPYDPDNGAVL